MFSGLTTINPFFIGLDIVYIQRPDIIIPGVKDDVWPDGYQLITYWYCGFIDREQSQLEPADESQQPQYMLVPLEDALARQDLKEKDLVAHAALAMFQAIWMVGKDFLGKKQ